MSKIQNIKLAEPFREKERESFLLKELDLMESEIKRLRAEGPSRLQFLFTITSSLLGSLLVLAGLKTIDIEWIRMAAIVISFLLFTFSLVTFQYLIGRDISCDRNARATARIRRYFLNRSPILERHISWQTSDTPTQWLRVDNSGIRRMNTLIASGVGGLCAGLLVFEAMASIWLAYTGGVTVTIATAIIMRLWVRRRLKDALDKATNEQRF